MATAEEEILFPELDDRKPEHEELMKLACAFHKAKQERSNLLTTSKEGCDAKMAKLIAQMHHCDIEKFKFKGIVVDLIQPAEKVEVKVEDEEAEESGDEE